MVAWCVTTRFHCGPLPSSGRMNVQKRMRAPRVGTILSRRLTYSLATLNPWPLCSRPYRLYVVKRPLSMMKGSVYREAARPMTVHGLPSVSAICVRLA